MRIRVTFNYPLQCSHDLLFPHIFYNIRVVRRNAILSHLISQSKRAIDKRGQCVGDYGARWQPARYNSDQRFPSPPSPDVSAANNIYIDKSGGVDENDVLI